jgi:hypothetical protein
MARNKVLQKQRQHESYLRNKEKVYQRMLQGRHKLMEDVTTYKVSKGCFFCPEKTGVCLDFHHINPNLKEDRISQLIVQNGRKKTFDEIEKCIVICSNCHRKLHAGLLTYNQSV